MWKPPRFVWELSPKQASTRSFKWHYIWLEGYNRWCTPGICARAITFFLIYINVLTDNISSQMRLFADDSSLFTRVEGVDQTHEKLIKDLETITNWAHQWKMVFNPDINKEAIEVIFSVKKNTREHPELIFNGIPVSREDYTKHLGVYLDSRLNFSKHIREAIIKATTFLERCLICHTNFTCDLISTMVMYYITIKEAISWILLKKFNIRLLLLFPGAGRVLAVNIKWNSPFYLLDHIPETSTANLSFRRNINRPPFSRTDRYDNSFFPFCINNWNNLDNAMKSLPSLRRYDTVARSPTDCRHT